MKNKIIKFLYWLLKKIAETDKYKMEFEEYTKVFTRKEIIEMSLDEFEKNEKVIFDQLRKGLIK